MKSDYNLFNEMLKKLPVGKDGLIAIDPNDQDVADQLAAIANYMREMLSPTPETSIKEAVDVALRFGMIDGAHHKQWVIDQMLRYLLNKNYHCVMNLYNSDPEYDAWDKGIPP